MSKSKFTVRDCFSFHKSLVEMVPVYHERMARFRSLFPKEVQAEFDDFAIFGKVTIDCFADLSNALISHLDKALAKHSKKPDKNPIDVLLNSQTNLDVAVPHLTKLMAIYRENLSMPMRLEFEVLWENVMSIIAGAQNGFDTALDYYLVPIEKQ